MHVNAFKQYVKISTRSRTGSTPSTLDIVIARHGYLIDLCVEPPIVKSDHCVLIFSLDTPRLAENRRMGRDLNRIDFTKLRDRALQITWVPEQDMATLEQRWLLLKGGLVQLLNEFAPVRPRKHLGKPRWWRRKIVSAIRRRNTEWRKYQETRASDVGCNTNGVETWLLSYSGR
ncbi:unnamed protein product [Dicrocoelium dendriticum]|nr:unnamed protein product [Dicrocoelium dendriticum]